MLLVYRKEQMGRVMRRTKCVKGLDDVAFLLAKRIFVQPMVGEAVHDCGWELYSVEL